MDYKNLVKGIEAVIATGLGAGLFPFAPATAATLIQMCWLYAVFPKPSFLEIPLLIVLIPVAIYCSGSAEKLFGHDAGEIVIDEVCGVMVTLFLIDRSSSSVVVAAFLLFRFFDIVKPWPVRRSQELPGGTGVVMDDLLAGLYAHATLRLLMASGIV